MGDDEASGFDPTMLMMLMFLPMLMNMMTGSEKNQQPVNNYYTTNEYITYEQESTTGTRVDGSFVNPLNLPGDGSATPFTKITPTDGTTFLPSGGGNPFSSTNLFGFQVPTFGFT